MAASVPATTSSTPLPSSSSSAAAATGTTGFSESKTLKSADKSSKSSKSSKSANPTTTMKRNRQRHQSSLLATFLNPVASILSPYLSYISIPSLHIQVPYLPTLLHLQNEVTLWLCLLLLTTASSHILYKDAYLSTWGDYKFLLFVGGWIGRHWLLRGVCSCSWVEVNLSDLCSLGGWFGGKTSKGRKRVKVKKDQSKTNEDTRFGSGSNRRRSFQTWLPRHQYFQYQQETHFHHYRQSKSHQPPQTITNKTSLTRLTTSYQKASHQVKYYLSFLSYLSPYYLCQMILNWVLTYGMAGQYCDRSAAMGVASSAMIAAGYGSSGGGGGGGGAASLGSLGGTSLVGGGYGPYGSGFSVRGSMDTAKSADHHHGHGHHKHSGVGPFVGYGGYGALDAYPGSNEGHVLVILSISRAWGTVCALSYAIWALIRAFVRGEPTSVGSGGSDSGGNSTGKAGKLKSTSGSSNTKGNEKGWLGWFQSLLEWIGLSSSSSEVDFDSFGSSMSSGGGGSKKFRRKQSTASNANDPHHGHSHHPSNPDADSHHHPFSPFNPYNPTSSNQDFLSGKLTFHHFPPSIRSHALHIQQMQTSESYRTLEKLWEASPPAQWVVMVSTALFLLYGILFELGGYQYIIGILSGGSINSNMNPNEVSMESNIPQFGAHPHHTTHADGYSNNNLPQHSSMAYWSNTHPFAAPMLFGKEALGLSEWRSLLHLMFLVVSLGTGMSLFFYGRVFLPVPEFVAGGNVLKAIRAETRILGGAGGSGSGGSGGSGGKYSKQKDKDLPYPEQYKSITTENRLRLYYKITLIRILENLFLCAILPQTEIVCRITEHCEPGPLLWGPSGVVGVGGRRYGRYGKGDSLLTGSYDALVRDDMATRMVFVTVAVITVVMLVGQMTLRDRTYLAIMGYISGEWSLVMEESEGSAGDAASGANDGSTNQSNESNIFHSRSRLKLWIYELFGIGSKPNTSPLRRSNSTYMQWDPKRRYQKGDRIAYDDCVYEAMSNSPEGPPFDPFLRAAHDIFKDELGHPNSSFVMGCLKTCCLSLAIVMGCLAFLWYGRGWNYWPLLVCVLASLLGGYSISHSGMRDLKRMVYGNISW